jgi:very-short-patch-repair endonuclease
MGVDSCSVIICHIHGEFIQDPYHHTNRRQGCPGCSESYGEEKIFIYLKNNNIDHIRQKRFYDCRNKKPLPFDFYLPNYNLCIEYDGHQHFEATNKINKKVFTKDESIRLFEQVQKHDNIKDEYCKLSNIELLRIPYTDFNNIENILKKYLKKS